MSALEHNSYVTRDENGFWRWVCADHPDATSGLWATEVAATEECYRHEGTDRETLLAEVERLRARDAAATAVVDMYESLDLEVPGNDIPPVLEPLLDELVRVHGVETQR